MCNAAGLSSVSARGRAQVLHPAALAKYEAVLALLLELRRALEALNAAWQHLKCLRPRPRRGTHLGLVSGGGSGGGGGEVGEGGASPWAWDGESSVPVETVRACEAQRHRMMHFATVMQGYLQAQVRVRCVLHDPERNPRCACGKGTRRVQLVRKEGRDLSN